MKLSIVIPVYNEEESLVQLHKEISDVAEQNQYDVEMIFIDDGSKDHSWDVVKRLSAADDRVRGIKFRRNFGKAAALNAGFEAAVGEIVMTMDADLQDNPQEIPAFLKQLEDEKLDVISGWKQVRHDPWHKVIPSRFFNFMVSYMTGVKLHDHNCGMKCYRREIFDEVALYGELHRFVPVLADARGYRVGEKVVEHRARQFGYSKYGFTRFVKGFLDLFTVWFLTGYGQRPQHLLGTIGLIAMTVGMVILTCLATLWIGSRMLAPIGICQVIHLKEHFPAIEYSIAALLLGSQLISVGIIAELIVSNKNRIGKSYSIAEQFNNNQLTTKEDKDTTTNTNKD
jgi:dolichol-phosphate mannosyltransferase